MSAEIKEFKIVQTETRDAKQELLDYLMWSMKFEKDPHDLYDDPIEIFRQQNAGNKHVA